MPKVYAYIDETGDRGSSPESSPIFGMAAVIVPESSAQALRDAVSQLRTDFKVPTNAVLSWKRYAKTHDRRKRAAEVLAAVPGVHVCYVYAKKSELKSDSYVKDRERFYNYVASKMYKSVLWAARNMGGTEIFVRFGHVKDHDHRGTKDYLQHLGRIDPKIPADLVSSLKWVSAQQYAESQAADLFGGFLKAAVWPDGAYGYVEESYLLSVWHKLRNSGNCAIPLGIMSMPSDGVLTTETWFPCDKCSKAS